MISRAVDRASGQVTVSADRWDAFHNVSGIIKKMGLRGFEWVILGA